MYFCMLGELEEMGTKQQDALVLVIAFQSLLYCIFDWCIQVLMNIWCNGMKCLQCGYIWMHTLLLCSQTLLPNFKTDSRTSVYPVCLLGAPERDNNGGMLGTMTGQAVIRQETAYHSHIRIQTMPCAPTASDFVIAQTAVAPTDFSVCTLPQFNPSCSKSDLPKMQIRSARSFE